MKYAIILITLVIGSVTQAGYLSNDLKNALAGNQGGNHDVIVYFEDAPKPGGTLPRIHHLRAQLVKTFLDRQLQNNLDAYQTVVTTNYRPLPIVNGLATNLSPTDIVRVSQLPFVKKVLLDTPVEPEPVVSETEIGDYDGEPAYGLINLKIDQIRKLYGLSGSGVIIGQIDTGVDGSHPDLSGKIYRYKDYVEVGNTVPKDTQGHGTHTAGTIAGGTIDKLTIGIAPNTRLVVARAIGGSSSISSLLEGMAWMLDPDGNPKTADVPRLVSCSWHTGNADQKPFYEALKNWETAGIIPNFSAGNGGPGAKTITHPKEHPFTLTSAAIDSSDTIANFSSRGPAVYEGKDMKKPEISSPGVDVISAIPGGKYAKKSGTSMAAPHTAGVIALFLEANPGITNEQIKTTLYETAIDKGDKDYDYTYGYGRINPLAALEKLAIGGILSGVIIDQVTKTPVINGFVTIKENGSTINADDQGKFRVFLKEGTYNVLLGAFGYLSVEEQVTIEKDLTVTLNGALTKAPTTSISGKVHSGQGHIKEYAIKAIGAPVTFSVDGQSGVYSGALPSGSSYRFEVVAFGYETLISEAYPVKGDAMTIDFTMKKLPDMILVNWDKSKDYSLYYREVLDHLDLEYKYLDNPTLINLGTAYLANFKTVLIFTGEQYSSGLFQQEDVDLLKNFVKNGRKVIITGKYLVSGLLKYKDFFENYLNLKYGTYIKNNTILTGYDSEFTLNGGDGAKNQNNLRGFVVKSESEAGKAVLLFKETVEMGGYAFVDQGALLLLGFGFEGISTKDERVLLMSKLLQ